MCKLLKYGFCNKSFGKDEPLTSWTLLQHICPHFWAWLLLYSASDDKYVIKVFNWSEVHLSEMTFYKIHTLECEHFRPHPHMCKCAKLLLTSHNPTCKFPQAIIQKLPHPHVSHEIVDPFHELCSDGLFTATTLTQYCAYPLRAVELIHHT